MSPRSKKKQILGWREWVSLPSLRIVAIRAKLDTGAKTSALHAWDISVREVKGEKWIRFRVLPMQSEGVTPVLCEAPLSDRRWVTSSSGTRELRYIIETTLQIGPKSWPIELSLTNREGLEFPMIIGREAMRNRLIVDPRASYRAGGRPVGVVDDLSDEPDESDRDGVDN